MGHLFRDENPAPTKYKYKALSLDHLFDVMLCSLVEVYLRFEGTYCLHLQGRKQDDRTTIKKSALSLFFAGCCFDLLVDL
jgi:hypothetical protein